MIRDLDLGQTNSELARPVLNWAGNNSGSNQNYCYSHNIHTGMVIKSVITFISSCDYALLKICTQILKLRNSCSKTGHSIVDKKKTCLNSVLSQNDEDGN